MVSPERSMLTFWMLWEGGFEIGALGRKASHAVKGGVRETGGDEDDE